MNFFKFSMLSIPSLNSAVVDWSSIIFDDSFSSQSQAYPSINYIKAISDFNLETSIISNFLTSFISQLDNISFI